MTGQNGTPEVFAPALGKLRADAAAHFGPGPVHLVATGYQDRRFSYLLRLAVCRAANSRPVSHIFLKVIKPAHEDIEAIRRSVARDFEATRGTYIRMLQHPGLGVVRPVVCYPDQLALVTEEAEGVTLLDYMHRHASWFPGVTRRAALRETLAMTGRWIRAFQRTDETYGYQRIDELREYVDVRLKLLVEHAGTRFDEDDRRRILTHLDLLGRLVPGDELRQVPIHGDMATGNILVSDGRVVVLDFGMATRGNRLHDVSRLFMQLDMLLIKPHFRASVIRPLQDALLKGLDPSLTADRPLFRFMLLLHRINNLATVSVHRAPFSETAYNRLVKRRHRRSIAAELHRGRAAPEAS